MKNLKNTKTLKNTVLSSLAAFTIPLGPSTQWHSFKFKNTSINKVEHKKNQLHIRVNKSASPLIFVFDKPKSIHHLHATVELKDYPKPLPTESRQGSKGTDDFILRVGLIYRGQNKLNWIQRQLAPSWLLGMEKLLPGSTGVGDVYFVSTCRDRAIMNKVIPHYLNSAMTNECVTLLENSLKKNSDKDIFEFSLHKKWAEKKDVLGVWVASDGDDLGSDFTITIKEIKIETH